jgi:hypothetical protein
MREFDSATPCKSFTESINAGFMRSKWAFKAFICVRGTFPLKRKPISIPSDFATLVAFADAFLDALAGALFRAVIGILLALDWIVCRITGIGQVL